MSADDFVPVPLKECSARVVVGVALQLTDEDEKDRRADSEDPVDESEWAAGEIHIERAIDDDTDADE